MDQATRARLIESYGAGYEVVAAALDGLTDRQLDRPDPNDGWTARQVAHHLADSEMTAAIRFRLLCEDNPQIQGYDERYCLYRHSLEELDSRLLGWPG